MSVDPNCVGNYLVDVINSKIHRVTYYKTIVERFDLPDLDGAWSSHPLRDIFLFLDRQDAAANRPFRTSVVIKIKTNSPGPGYFEALEELKGIADPKTKAAREKLWLSELNKVYSYPW
ncbi:hypothetical protein [Vibrio parahaemolyticus]|uniref:hypothetical protein n=1 Tax=Vibrio parahaemolyticus TaxID=670 RepID=UPI000470A4E6|nr:hypothetical protein [Vibrio parahaemolyticus]EJT3522323.1 hypothetical protein [Vibrio parahaemolyticus]EJX1333405.1 hypothetical protein [Vibrio parahaemolyticus]MDF5078332.1 hypothetical protein [Vibrio parahaemolyticus]MDF5414926.1 hypothetical protein [Vibrio parahaemolyticus]MDF5425181.1 hypothetical protein [Vibrio parahaemolyticus]